MIGKCGTFTKGIIKMKKCKEIQKNNDIWEESREKNLKSIDENAEKQSQMKRRHRRKKSVKVTKKQRQKWVE